MLSRRWLARHALLLSVIAVFVLLGRWQWSRADAGNARSVGYAFEWPLFGAFAVYWWWRSMRLELHPAPAEQAPPRPAVAPQPAAGQADLEGSNEAEPDDELSAYNRYLAWLNEQDQRSAR